MIGGTKTGMHHDFAYQKDFHKMVNFPQEDLPAVKECKDPRAQSPQSDECLCSITHTRGF